MNNSDIDVLIVGGGTIGVCSAYYLNKQGFRVTIIEKNDVASGCSFANAGLIVPSHCIPLANPGAFKQGLAWLFDHTSPFYIKPRFNKNLLSWLRNFWKSSKQQTMIAGLKILRDMNYRSAELLDQIITMESLQCEYHKNGWLLVFKTENGFKEGIEDANLLRDHDVECEILNRKETIELEPMLLSDVIAGILFPQDAHLNPEMFVNGLAQRLIERGVSIQTQSEVIQFNVSKGMIKSVKTTKGEFYADQILIATGSWSHNLVKALGITLPIEAAKGYSITLNHPKASPKIPLYLSEAKVAVTPLQSALRFAGTLELSGLDFSMNSRRLKQILNASEDYLSLNISIGEREAWCGLRPCSPDGLPIIGRSDTFDNLIIATGHCMLGITLAPITGQLVTQIASSQNADIDLSPLSVSRFDYPI